MSSLKLEFPVLVRVIYESNGKSYQVSPLFTIEPVIKNERFEKAIRNFKTQVRKEIRELPLDRDNLNSVLWYLFNPEIHFEIIHLDFLSGKNSVSGDFSVTWFELKGQTFICLPGFNKFIFIAPVNESGKVNVKEQAARIIEFKMREERKEYGEKWNPGDYMANKNEFIALVDFDVFIKHSTFPFEEDFSSLFSSLFNNGPMYGDSEIEKVGSDMNLLFPEELNRALYRDELTERVYQVIYQKEKTAVVLVGEPGVGKTTLIHEVIHRYLENNDTKQFSFLEKIWDIDPVRIIAGMSIIGMWEKRFELIIEYAMTRLSSNFKKKGQDKLYFRNMVALLRVGKSARNSLTLSDVLKTFMENRNITVIGEATPAEWKVVQELDRKFADLFQVIRIPELPENDAVKVVLNERAKLEHENQCQVSNLALSEIFNIQRIFMKQSSFPGNAVNFLKRLTTKYRNQSIDKSEVLKTFQEVHPVSLQMLDKTERIENARLEEFIRKHLIGQDEAITTMIDSIHLIKANLNDPEKPYGVFLFIGPTGVGKTEAAKIMARYLFGNENQLVRFDMNEYIDYGAVRRLVGDIYYPEGQLTSKIRNQPFCVLLFDEIEKAHYNVHNLLLQILGEGRLSDAIGRTVDFTRTVIIMTSNLGAKDAGKMVGFHQSQESVTSTFKKAVEDFFAPEFINRIDRIVPFKHLDMKDIILITRLQIKQLMQRDGFVRRNMILNISENVLDKIASQGFDPTYGARALKRSIEKNLVALTADQIVSVPPGKPMIFEIFLSKGNILPKVTVLEEVDSIKEFNVNVVPDEKDIPGFFEGLLEDINEIGDKISGVLEAREEGSIKFTGDNWLIYDFKARLIEIKNELLQLLADLETKNSRAVSILRAPKFTRSKWRSYERSKNFKDLFAYMDIREFLYETYQKSKAVLQDDKSVSLQYFLDVAFLRFFSEKLKNPAADNVLIQIIPLSSANNPGLMETEYLKLYFLQVLNLFNFHLKIPKTEAISGEINIIGQGTGLADMLKGENGIHMFFVPHENSVPVRVKIESIPDGMDHTSFIAGKKSEYQENLLEFEKGNISGDKFFNDYGKIIRYYCLPYNENTGNDTITDLQTNLIMRSELNNNEIKLLMYGNIIC